MGKAFQWGKGVEEDRAQFTQERERPLSLVWGLSGECSWWAEPGESFSWNL
jgi:hypothetical protein